MERRSDLGIVGFFIGSLKSLIGLGKWIIDIFLSHLNGEINDVDGALVAPAPSLYEHYEYRMVKKFVCTINCRVVEKQDELKAIDIEKGKHVIFDWLVPLVRSFFNYVEYLLNVWSNAFQFRSHYGLWYRRWNLGGNWIVSISNIYIPCLLLEWFLFIPFNLIKLSLGMLICLPNVHRETFGSSSYHSISSWNSSTRFRSP